MTPSLTLLVVVVGAYLAAHVAFGWIARRFQIVSGAEYLLLGFLLGPQVSGLLSTSLLDGFAPFLSLALGWIGAIVGAQFYLPQLIRIPAAHHRIAFTEALLTFATVSGSMAWVLGWSFGVPVSSTIAPAIAMGAVATATAPTGIAMVARRLRRPGALVRQLEITAAVDALVAVAGIGLLIAILHPEPPGALRPPTATEWVVISIGLGVVGGVLFHLFLGDETESDRIFIGLLGAILLVSGAAAYLRLSPLLPAMLVGAILIHTTTNREETQRVLQTVERPIYFVLLIFAGAAWLPIGLPGVLAVAGFLLVRPLAKIGGAALAARANGAIPALGDSWGRALIGQGGLALAIALNYQIYGGTPLANTVFAAAIVSVLFTDVTAARVAEQVVRRAPASGQPPSHAAESPAAEESAR